MVIEVKKKTSRIFYIDLSIHWLLKYYRSSFELQNDVRLQFKRKNREDSKRKENVTAICIGICVGNWPKDVWKFNFNHLHMAKLYPITSRSSANIQK